MPYSMIRYELHVFFTALAFLSRIPTPQLLPFDAVHLSISSRYFPLVGLLLGGIAASIFFIANQFLYDGLALLLSMVMVIWLTGAFHEDGFADCCDGFGGGWQASQVLEIMKDSRLGTYGTVGLLSILALKYSCLQALSPLMIMSSLVVGHCWSRLLAVSFMVDMRYVQEGDHSKVESATSDMSLKALLFAILTTMPLLWWVTLEQLVTIVLALLVFRFLFARYLNKRLGGYTGDCLGMAQQFSEVIIYASIVACVSGSTA